MPWEVFEKYKSRLPDNKRKHAKHWYSEQDRVEQGVKAWKRENLEEYRRLIFESGWSSIEYWKTGSPDLKKVYKIMKMTDSIYGERFSGAGFKECCMTQIDPTFEESIKEKDTREYIKAFPQLERKFSVHFCQSENGVSFGH